MNAQMQNTTLLFFEKNFHTESPPSEIDNKTNYQDNFPKLNTSIKYRSMHYAEAGFLFVLKRFFLP